MNIEDIRQYCLSKKGASESFPFDEHALVFKVAGKMFGILNLGERRYLNLKCDPERAIELRETYAFITPGFHMNKKHWNSVVIEEDVDSGLIAELIDHSYGLVFSKLPKKAKESLND